MRRRLLEGGIALDRSVLVEVVLATEGGEELVEMILDDIITPYTTTHNVTEALYVLYRLLGMEEAEKRVSLMVDSGYFKVVSSDRVGRLAAECKCLFPISIVDCHTLALAKRYSVPALFYRLERRLKPMLDDLRRWVGSEILFLGEGQQCP